MESVSERVLPHSIDAERAVLGAILVDNSAWAKAASVMAATHFFRDAHRRIFETMTTLIEERTVVDFVTVKEHLQSVGSLDACGGAAYIASLADGVPRATNVEYYARIVREKATLRSMIYTANGVLSSAYEGSDPSDTLIDDAVTRLLAIAGTSRPGAVSLSDALSSYMHDLDDDTGAAIPTGFRDLDDLIGGIQRRRLTFIAARPSVGKTSLALAIADHLTERGIPIGFITLEMDPEALGENLLAGRSRASSDKLRRKTANKDEWEAIAHAIEDLSSRRFQIVPDASTLAQVDGWCRRLVEEHGAQAIFLDYIQMMGDGESRNRQAEMASFSRGLKRIAKDLNVAMVVLSQLSRASEARTDKRPQLSDLRESGALEQDADLAILLFRAEMHKPTDDNKGIAEVIVAKNRQGPVGTRRLCFISETARFEDLALF